MNIAIDRRFMMRHPAHVIALGFGAGLSLWAPGTVGTLSAVDVRGPVGVRNEGHTPYAQELAILRQALERHGLSPQGRTG